MRSSPIITVIMPAYNCELYISDAIKSILEQSFHDFELIIFDDCSTDHTLSIIKRFKDDRIILINNNKKIGHYKCRNLAIQMAHGEFICGMDADDISLPQRFHAQVNFMKKKPEVGFCGTQHKIIPSGFIQKFKTNNEEIKVFFLSNYYCSHPTLMMRKTFLDKYNLRYDERYYYASDYDLCSRAFKYTTVENIPEVLYLYRKHDSQISTFHSKEQARFADQVRINQLIQYLNFKLEEIPVVLHLLLMKRFNILENHKQSAEQWIKLIIDRNKTVKFYQQDILENFLFSSIIHCFDQSKHQFNKTTLN